MRISLPVTALGFAVLFGSVYSSLPAQAPSTPPGHSAFVSRGLVGVGRIAASARDKYGETLGSFSALTIDAKTWKRHPDGSYSGTLYMQPDRGYNNPSTTNWRARMYILDIRFTPAPDGAARQDQVQMTVRDTMLLTENDGTPLTALDATPLGTGKRAGFPPLPQACNGRISLDAEGIAQRQDGSFYISDEYGPYIYRFSPDGKLRSAIRPPEAFIPKRHGADSFSSNNPGAHQPAPVPAEPVTGRQNNQGFEGLSLSPDGRTLLALLQSATRQDGGDRKSGTSRANTRLLAYDVSAGRPSLQAEYVLQLPTYESEKGAPAVAAQSEMLSLGGTQYFVLAHDSHGHARSKPTSVYRKILIYDTAHATNIAGSAFDDPAHPVAPAGVLVPSVTPATRTEFIDLNDSAQLTKFGLHNGPVDDANNLAEKWEAMALVPALDPAAPDDFFLFVGNDNDFITQNGFQDGLSYSHPSGLENDSMLLVYRITLPSRPPKVTGGLPATAGPAPSPQGHSST